MAQFDESKVINALHPEKAEIGKKYWFTDNLLELKRQVEENIKDHTGELDRIRYTDHCPFEIKNGNRWQFLYPYEEPPKQRMTNRQLMEWLAKGSGEYCCNNSKWTYSEFNYLANNGENRELDPIYKIRSWDSEEWLEPTVDIYLRDCKGGK